MLKCIFGLLFIFLCSCAGCVCVLFNNKKNKNLRKIFVGFATGVMLAASIWSLLIPAIESSKNIMYVIIGFILGALILIILDIIYEKTDRKRDYVDKMYLALTIHNVPEGLVVGLTYGFCLITGQFYNGYMMAFAIGVQNIPESIAISIPLYNKEGRKIKTLILIVLSAIVEPVVGFLGFIMFSYMVKISSVLLSVAAGSMIYVIVSELVPEFVDEKRKVGEIGFLIGFIIMMLLDVLL